VSTAQIINNVLYIIPKYFDGQLVYFDLLKRQNGLTEMKDWKTFKTRAIQEKNILDCGSCTEKLYFTIPDTSLVVYGNKDGLNGLMLGEKERISCITVSSDAVWAISEKQNDNELVRYDYEGNIVSTFSIPEQKNQYCRIFFLNNKLFLLPTTTDVIMMYDILDEKWDFYKANGFPEHNLICDVRKSWLFWDYQNDESYIYFGTFDVGLIRYSFETDSFITEKITFPKEYSKEDYVNDLINLELSKENVVQESLVLNVSKFIDYIEKQ
jgi:hypothetical protein